MSAAAVATRSAPPDSTTARATNARAIPSPRRCAPTPTARSALPLGGGPALAAADPLSVGVLPPRHAAQLVADQLQVPDDVAVVHGDQHAALLDVGVELLRGGVGQLEQRAQPT